jgi:hypothetical protein
MLDSRVSQPLNEEMRRKLQMLVQFTESLSLTVKSDVLEIKRILDGTGRIPPNCSSRNSAAAMQLRHTEKKLNEVNGMVAEIKKTLSA